MNWMEGLAGRERGCRRGGNGGLNLYSSLFSISRTCRKLHGQLWIILQAAVLVCKCPYHNATCICVHAYVICHGSSFKPASLIQDILVSNASKLDSQSVSHSHCENRLHVRSLKPCITAANTATYARILLSPILGCAMEITLASAVRDPTLSLQVCSSVRSPVGSHDWLSNRGQNDGPSYDWTARHDTWHMDTDHHSVTLPCINDENQQKRWEEIWICNHQHHQHPHHSSLWLPKAYSISLYPSSSPNDDEIRLHNVRDNGP